MENNEKIQKFHDSIKDSDVMELMNKKMVLVKELDKNMKNITNVDISKYLDVLKELDKVVKALSLINVTKGSERQKISKSLEKVNQVLETLNIIDQLNSEKTKILKSLEKVSELAESIPVVEKLIKDKDF